MGQGQRSARHRRNQDGNRLKKYSDAYNNRNADVEDVPADAPAVDTEPVADMDYEAVETAAETVSREVAEHPDRRARRVARTGDEIEREYGLKTLDGRSIEEMQANIANAKAALDAGEFDDDPDVRKEVQRILHFADQIDRRRTAALAEQEPVAEPEYIAADAMAEPDPVAEPDTVSGETPASEPEYAASDPVADVEPEPAQEPEYAAADAMAAPEPEPAQEPEYVAADALAETEPDTIAEVDPVPSDPELAQRLQDCEALPITVAASRVEDYIQQDMDQARSALESAAAYAGLPSISDLPDNVERLELREDGSVVAVIDGDADTTPAVTEPIADMPDQPAPAPDISGVGDTPISPPAVAGDVDTSAETTDPVESGPSVEIAPRWDSMSMAEKAAAITRYNDALQNYRTQQALARLVNRDGDNADVVETYCDYLRERLGAQKPDAPQPVAVASPMPPALDMSQVQMRTPAARRTSSRAGLQPRSRVARMLMGEDVRPRPKATGPAGPVNEGMPDPIEYRPGQEPVALAEIPDDSMESMSNKRRRRGRRKPDEEDNRGAPQINLVVRAT